MTDRQRVSHVLRRLTFGPTTSEVDAAEKAGLTTTVSTALTRRAAPPEPDIDPPSEPPQDTDRDARRKARAEQNAELSRWWLRQMAADSSAAEKLTFFWHGHWATSIQKVKSAAMMFQQQQTFRRYGTGDTGAFVRAMLRDPALILWLDGQKNTAKAPNENLARELMELFTLGVGNYTEDDVKAGARVLTGWTIDRSTGTAKLMPKRHDKTPVTLLGRTGVNDTDAYADLLVRHEAHAPFLASRLWVRYGSGAAPSAAVTGRLVAAFGPGRSVTAMLQALALDPEFAGTGNQLVKQPVEWVIGAIRQLGIDVGDLDEKQLKQMSTTMRALGQVPLRPPSVGGWPAGTAWLTTSSAQVRLRSAPNLVTLAPAAVASLEQAARTDRLDALARLLVIDQWSDRTAAVLTPAAKDPKRLLALGLATPEYAVH
ncbi:DUF1800 domain-containing protein [Winogradskya consettensis]|uniref:DUF1800 domain-containing protein n=1 Tax=Winogradskya consettensis TaxID=113560 RepID=A0A919T4A7_9ACTN|nr:DUF1800 domain-containing protein [Actinoplanes consettensis]GIM84557.1 hypothetical protein Aco04nite_91990 [Actinoplanes consettensis]